MSTYLTSTAKILKPELDDRAYRFITLSNNLKALVIQDPTTDKSAASLDVNVGAFEDPEELPGLAHFCEHLLFMGSTKFPDENKYSKYLSENGGYSNAYTAAQNTNYYFEVNHDHLFGALDRFSGFFSCPLFSKDSVDKEINAVDSENKKNLQNDLWRLYQLDKSMTNVKHPYHKFSTGNLQTLGEIPKQNGLNIRDELLKFYNKSYSANLMKLVVLGREDLDTLSTWVHDLFHEVRDNDITVPEYPEPLLTDEHVNRLVKAKPVKDLKKLEIEFPAPDTEEHWKVRPAYYFTHLLGHEGSGSLLAYLKKQGWAQELSAGYHVTSKDNAALAIDVDLTDDGLLHYEDVLVSVFQYMQLLKTSKPQEYIYNELRDISESSFRFKQKGSPSSTVSQLAKSMEKTYIPDEYILSKSVFREYNPQVLESFIQSIKDVRVTLVSQKVETTDKENWYGTDYAVEKIHGDLLKRMEHPGLNCEMWLPRPNEFIATNFNVEKTDAEPLKEPVVISETETTKIWYKKDDMFWVPKGYIFVSLKLPNTFGSLVNNILTTMYVELVNDSLKDIQYNAEMADLKVNFHKTNQGLDLTISGYNEKSTVLLARFLEGIVSFQPSKKRFDIFQKKVEQRINNHLYEVPYAQIAPVQNYLSNERSWSNEEKLEIIKSLNYDDFVSFIPSIFQHAFAEILVHGNLSKDVAIEVGEMISKIFPSVKGGYHQKLRSYMLPKGSHYRYEAMLRDEDNVNSCIQHVTQVDTLENEELIAQAFLLAQMIKEPAFNQLRTKEQLGYVVFSSVLATHSTLNIRVLVQSERDTAFLESRIIAFYNTFGDMLKDMSDDQFISHKKALQASLLQKYKNLGEENSQFVNSIHIGDYNFQRKSKRAAILESVTKSQIEEFFNKYFVVEPTRLVIHLKSRVSKESEHKPEGELIKNVGEFKSRLFLAPVRQPKL